MSKKSGADLGRENAARLADYLASIDVLPSRGGKVNVSQVARACGFDRQVLYNNPSCKALLDTAVIEKGLDGIEARESGEHGDDTPMVPLKKLREVEQRNGALEKKVSELRARIVGLETRLRRQEIIDEELISRGRRASPRPISLLDENDK